MKPSEIIRFVVEALERLEIPYFITGSVASISYGEFRSTADVDIVAKVELAHVRRLCELLANDEFYLSPEAVREAVTHRGQFNIIDAASGFKADIMIPGNSPRDEIRFQRAVEFQPMDQFRSFWYSSPEDIILSKLEFYREGQSDKHIRDIAGIIKRQRDRLDRGYIEEWAERLELADLWRSALRRSEGN